MLSALLLVGVVVAVFVGFNIGGSNTGVAFGPAVGSGAIGKLGAGALMTVFALLGGWTVGREVVDTLGSGLIVGDPFTPLASVGVLFFIGGALFVSNVFGVPASTSMTAVGAIVGLGLASGGLRTDVVLEIVAWWLVAPIVGFWVSAVVGRYAYDAIAARLAIAQSEGALVTLDRSSGLPRPALGPGTTPRELAGTLLVIGIACFMAFSAGASNVANAVAPLVGSGAIEMNVGILLGGGAIGLGAMTIARRTLETMGNDLTELPLAAALVVATVSASLVTVLSALGIPASFVVIATMSVVGLGWGRASTLSGLTGTPADIGVPVGAGDAPAAVEGGVLDGDGGREADAGPGVDGDTSRAPDPDPTATTAGSTGAGSRRDDGPRSDDRPGTAGTGPDPVGGVDPDVTGSAAAGPSIDELYRPRTTARVLVLQNVVPAVATVGAYLLFRFGPV